MTDVMTKAWRIKKDHKSMSFSDCLKLAWKIQKTEIKLHKIFNMKYKVVLHADRFEIMRATHVYATFGFNGTKKFSPYFVKDADILRNHA